MDRSGRRSDPSDWTPGPPPGYTWEDGCGCAPPTATSIVHDITITGKPGTITAVENGLAKWALVLNDETPAGNMRLDRFDDAGKLINSPISHSRDRRARPEHAGVRVA